MKKLAWFNTSLLSNHGDSNFVKKFGTNPYWPLPSEPRFTPGPALWHMTMNVITTRGICMVDQTGTSLQYGDNLDMARTLKDVPGMPGPGDPAKGEYVDKCFNEVTAARVNAMYEQADKNGIDEIRISWSGGIDSNYVLAAIMQHPKSIPWLSNKKIVVYTTNFARREDPLVWDWLMQSDLPVRFLDYSTLSQDTGKWMLVTGEGEPYGTMFSALHAGYVENTKWSHWHDMEPYFLYRDPSGLGWDYFRALMATSPIPIETCYHAWWYFENSVESQCYLYRLSAYSESPVIDPQLVFPGTRTFWFLGDQAFAHHGAYVVTNRLIDDDPNRCKWHLQQYTADWLCRDPWLKRRFMSQSMVPKRVHKWRIYDDLSWDQEDNLGVMR